jgi:hypothetical protein
VISGWVYLEEAWGRKRGKVLREEVSLDSGGKVEMVDFAFKVEL